MSRGGEGLSTRVTSSPGLEGDSLMDEEQGQRRGTEGKELGNIALNECTGVWKASKLFLFWFGF